MSKVGLSSAIKTHAALSRTDFVVMWKITRTDGTIKGLTEYYKDISFDLGDGDGPITYSAADGHLRSAIRSNINLDVAVMEVEGVVGDVITADDVRAGKYDNATVDVFMVNFNDLSMGDWPLHFGFFGTFELDGIKFKTELSSLSTLYQNEVVELFSAGCRADLGDSRCKVKLKLSQVPVWEPSTSYTEKTPFDAGTGDVVRDPNVPDRYFHCIGSGMSAALASGVFPSWNTAVFGETIDGTVTWLTIRAGEVQTDVTSVVDRGNFSIANYAGDAPPSFWNGGVVEWVTGENSGRILEIKTWDDSSGAMSIKLYKQAPLDIAVGDTVKVRPGCNKILAVCRDTYLNTLNARAEFRVPGFKQFIRTPNAKTG